MSLLLDELLKRHYTEHSLTLELKPVGGGHWARVDGVPYQAILGSVSHVPDKASYNDKPEDFLRQIGGYTTNNGRVAFQTPDALYVGRSSGKNILALQQAGYTQKSLFVPFSNSEIPLDAHTRDELLLVRHGYDSEDVATILHARECSADTAAARKITPMTEPETAMFVRLDKGMAISTFGKIHTFEFYDADQHVGHFASNNGTVAFVNERGQVLVGHSDDAHHEVLHRHGYEPGSMFVPLSNGESVVGYVHPSRIGYGDLSNHVLHDPVLETKVDAALGRSPAGRSEWIVGVDLPANRR